MTQTSPAAGRVSAAGLASFPALQLLGRELRQP